MSYIPAWQQPLLSIHDASIYVLASEREHIPDLNFANFWTILDLAPAIVAATVLLLLLLQPLLSLRPKWMHRFIQEPFVPSECADERQSRWPIGRHAIGLLALSVFGTILQTLRGILPDFMLSRLYPAIAWMVMIVLILIFLPRTVSAPLLLITSSLCTATLIDLAYEPHPRSLNGILGIGVFLVSVSSIVVVLCMPFRDPSLPTKGISKPFERPNSALRSPEDRLSLWQWLTVSWMTPMISTGMKRQLNDEDVWDLPFEFKHGRLTDAFRVLKGSVIRRLMIANGMDLVIISTLGIVEMGSNLIEPVLLQQLLRSLAAQHGRVRSALTWATLTLLVRLVAAQSGVISLWYSRRAYERSRGEMVTMLYEKTLRRKIIQVPDEPLEKANGAADETVVVDNTAPTGSQKGVMANINNFRRRTTKLFERAKTEKTEKGQQSASMGKILNLMRGDAYEVAQRFWDFPDLIKQPLGVILSIFLIWQIIGWPSLAGIVVLLVAQGVNTLIARTLVYWETVRRSATDTKLEKITRFVEAIRHLRWYGWQESRLQDILEARQYELHLRVITGLWNTLIDFMTNLSGNLFPVVAFTALTALAGVPLTVDIAFPAIDLLNLLFDNLRRLPGLITVMLNAYVSVNRLESYMQEPDKKDQKAGIPKDTPPQLTNASFAWPGTDKAVLSQVSVKFPKGVTIIYGEVAAGKTALLQAILGELDYLGGQISIPDTAIAYCAQTPWLQSMSIRENILFSYPYDEQRYKDVLNACALIPDLAGFQAGDLSNLGENGIGLSGGQRARVALARAVYSPAEIVLLDDPLSALDHQTAEFIVQKLLAGPLLEGRTVVLVTHRTELCHDVAGQWLLFTDGTVTATDPERSGFEAKTHALHRANTDTAEENARETEDAAVPEKFIEEEHRAHGDVQLRVYWEYIKAGKIKWWAVLIIVASVYRAMDVLETWFIKEWGEAYKGSTANGLFDRLPPPQANIKPWLEVFLGLALAGAFTYLISSSFMLVIVYAASKKMFIDVMHRVSHATFRFYDVTPVGRLMNRLTSDMSTVDGNISRYFMIVVFLTISWVSSVIIIASVAPLFLVFGVVLTILFVVVFLRFLPTSQSLRRLEMTSLTPLLSNFGALSEGLTTVRAFCAQRQFLERVIAVTDTFQKFDHFYWSLQAWLMLRFDTLSACSTFILTLLAIYSGLSPGLTAFVLIAASKFVTATHLLCRYYGHLQMDFVSVERVVEMLHLEQEPSGEIDPPAWWPSFTGDIIFDNVTLQYAETHDPALKNISLRIPAGSNCAIVGRTGSGKSTFALALLATLPPTEGSITIDSLPLATISKQTLRSRLTFLAQDPILFPGTLSSNLDPLSQYPPSSIDDILTTLNLTRRYAWTRDTVIHKGGSNLSQGQRQLVGLARALLRRSSVVILDEATASVDLETSREVMRVLRRELGGSTVVTIAHRLEAVAGADWCIVLDKGRVVRSGKVRDGEWAEEEQ